MDKGAIMRYTLIAALVAMLLSPSGAAATSTLTKAERSKRQAVHQVFAYCNTWKCVRRVTRKHEAREMRRYKAHPLPWCTWGPESGAGRPEWSMQRYRQPAIGQGPVAGGGKFQIIDSTWRANGGSAHAAHAQFARPVHQERVARRVMAGQGANAWTNC